MQVGRHGARGRHARELSELIDQALERLDLGDDRVGALPHERRAAAARLGEMAPQAFRRSWIGVSGFLISCASRRATSRQAATRCARISGVTSSSTSTVLRAAVGAGDTGGRGRQVALASFAHEGDFLHERSMFGARGLVEHFLIGCEIGPGEDVAAGLPTVRRRLEQRIAGGFIVRSGRRVERNDAGGDALENGFDVAAAASTSTFFRSRSRLDLLEPRATVRARPPSRRTLRREPHSSLASARCAGRRCPAPIARAASASCCTGRVMRLARYSPPGRADENQQRHRDEERRRTHRRAAVSARRSWL